MSKGITVIASHPEYEASIELHAFASPSAPPYKTSTRHESDDVKYSMSFSLVESIEISHRYIRVRVRVCIRILTEMTTLNTLPIRSV